MIRLHSQPSAQSSAILITAAALLSLGVVMVFSATESLAKSPFEDGFLKSPALRQALFSFVALITMLMVSLCPYQSWNLRRRSIIQPALFLGIASIALLVMVLMPQFGEVRNGARRWLSVGPSSIGLGFQPSEIAKLSLVMLLAAICGAMGTYVRKFWLGFLPLCLLIGTFVGLVGIEDFGTAVLLGAVGFGILIAAGARLWHLGLVSMPAVAGFVYLIYDRSHRMKRLTAFLDPEADPQGAGYQPLQSLMSIASGDWWGCGLGAGVQKYGHLPEARTDFIFAVICEELGIIGGLGVIGLFAVVVWQGRLAAQNAPDAFGRLFALGATLTIGLQAAINIAVVTVSVPTKGISLPLISAGGTGVIFFSVLVGMLANVARTHPSSYPVNETRSPQNETNSTPQVIAPAT